MTAEEFIKSVSVEDCAGGHIYRRVSEDDALKAIEMTRLEKAQTFVGIVPNKFDNMEAETAPTFTLQDILDLLPRQMIDEYASPLMIKCTFDLLVQVCYKDIYVTAGEEKKQRELYELERKVADLINEGFIKSYDQMITYLKNVYRHKYLPAVFS